MESINRNTHATQLGTILLILGGLALLSNLGLFWGLGSFMTAALFAVGGVLLLRLYRDRPRRAVLIVPSFALFAVAAAIVGGALSGGLFLGVLGLGFVAVYARDKRQWWAVIPAGVLLTLGLVAGLDALVPHFGAGSVLFIGWAATFALLTVLPEHRQKWGIYPALGLAAVAVLVLSSGGGWLLPVIMVGAGLYLLSSRGHAVLGQGHRGGGGLVVRDPGAGGDAASTAGPAAGSTEGAVEGSTAVSTAGLTASSTGGSVAGSNVNTPAEDVSALAAVDEAQPFRSNDGDVVQDADARPATAGDAEAPSDAEAKRGSTEADGA